ILATQFQITANVWSVTSFNELRKNMDAVARDNRLKSPEKRALCYVEQCFQNHAGPVIAATDYIKVTANQIRDAVHAPYYVLGTDGFGRSDTREALREFFEVDANMIAYTALYALTEDKKFSHKQLLTARDALHIDANRSDPAHT
ncbi:MAG: pyruvate dehydrogenase subunit E1, partial [uncultured bacterium]